MKREDFRLIGNVGISVGGGLILLAIVLLVTSIAFHVNRDFWGNITNVSYDFPNLGYAITSGIIGIVTSGIGSAFRIRGKEEKLPPPPSP